MSPSSPSAFCGLGHRSSNPPHPTSDAHSTTSSQFRRQLVLSSRPLLLRRGGQHTSSKSRKSASQSHDKSSANHSSLSHTSHPSPSTTSLIPSIQLSRNLKPKKTQPPGSHSPNFSLPLKNNHNNNSNHPERRPADFPWARHDQLSVIFEYSDETRSGSPPNSESNDPFNNNSQHRHHHQTSSIAIPDTIREILNSTPTSSSSLRAPKFDKIGVRERASNSRIPSYGSLRNPNNNNDDVGATRPRSLIRRTEEGDTDFKNITKEKEEVEFSASALGIRMATSIGGSERMTPEVIPRPIGHPPKDLESIARIDSSLIFEHFTTSDAWVLGSALRERLLPHPTPVVISISLSNAHQILFHCCTHSGTMPDNDSWVSRKRKTVLRWGVSTWYMWCKFEGDEGAFARKYGLGNEAGEYAIHGGGVPIRVTGVEGVVAVVVVSGLKQWEDHGVIVEVIRDLYY
ncbi:hypothetical protein DSL72_007484 [Monilinia vaccinii-corymbosi]|uniref:DUF967 domain protein n=1 Tax=Monilinia vaccinii-corymbosi TaxID=61207 RepID=A0A8A3PHT2_9HELO|nr:hypothetical protein DSL72_007484 [Monilinia vaccinii-corymbosi]